MAETGEDHGRRPGRDRRRDTRMVLIGVAAVLLVWFALANFQDVTIDFWVTHAHAPLVVVIAIAGVLGAAVAVGVRRLRRHSAEN